MRLCKTEASLRYVRAAMSSIISNFGGFIEWMSSFFAVCSYKNRFNYLEIYCLQIGLHATYFVKYTACEQFWYILCGLAIYTSLVSVICTVTSSPFVPIISPAMKPFFLSVTHTFFLPSNFGAFFISSFLSTIRYCKKQLFHQIRPMDLRYCIFEAKYRSELIT